MERIKVAETAVLAIGDDLLLEISREGGHCGGHGHVQADAGYDSYALFSCYISLL
jgi:hypothetical protein